MKQLIIFICFFQFGFFGAITSHSVTSSFDSIFFENVNFKGKIQIKTNSAYYKFIFL